MRQHPTDDYSTLGELPDFTAFYISRGHLDSPDELYVKTRSDVAPISKLFGYPQCEIVDESGQKSICPSFFSVDIPTHLGVKNS